MECTDCSRYFSSKQILDYHIKNKVCHKQNILECDDCNRYFSSKQMLYDHTKNKVCHKEEPYCSWCDKEFSSKQMARYHKRRVCKSHYCGNKECHKIRCNPQNSQERNLLKKEIDLSFGGNYFDQIHIPSGKGYSFQAIPFEIEEYWNGICRLCGYKRDGQHISQCLKPWV